MNKKELKKYFGHSFPALIKENPEKRVYKFENNFIAWLDRAKNVISVLATRPMVKQTIEHNFGEYSEEEWLKRINDLYKGQPISLVKDNLQKELSIFESNVGC